ncbi:enoyl-CoA hydratase/isomerase family protein, partial [Oxalobacteraceae bacterium OM1]
MSRAAVNVERKDAIAWVTLSNPGKLNALALAMWRTLAETFTALDRDESLRCIIMRGDGGNFAAGADIEEFESVRATLADGMQYHNDAIANALRAIAECRHPTVAAIEGVCVGGGLE